jgi:hypothetical protein
MYTKRQLMPKRLEEVKENLIDGKMYFVAVEPKDENYWQAFRCSSSWSENRFYIIPAVDWIIDIPNPPDEVMPLEYPKHKPDKGGVYVVHLTGRRSIADEWRALEWFDYWWGAGYNIDYFIPICLDELDEEPYKNDVDTAITEIERAIKNCNGLVMVVVKKYLDEQGYDIVKRQPEIAPCPNPECDKPCHCEKTDLGGGVLGRGVEYTVTCGHCGYYSPVASSEHEAIRLHNAIANWSK